MSNNKSQISNSSLFRLIFATALLSFAATAAIPPPPWGSGSPTSNFQVLQYVMGIMTNLPPETVEELKQAQQRKASAGELLSIVYDAKLNSSSYGVHTSSRAPQPVLPWEMGTVTNCAERIAMLKQMYGDQWKTLCGGGEAAWGARLHTSATAFRQLDDLELRLRNVYDQLNDLDSYSNVFLIDGAAMSLFWHGLHLHWSNDVVRAERVFSFLLHPQNNNGFVVGGSHYFLGELISRWRKDPSNAFVHYMMVHKYPACLVFTAHSYIGASRVLRQCGFPSYYADALLSVDIPCADFFSLKAERHFVMAEHCRNRLDYREMVRHLQCTLLYDSNRYSVIQTMRNMSLPHEQEGLWNQQLTNQWSAQDTLSLIRESLEAPLQTPNDDLYLDALAHDWPVIENVHCVVLTNRLLSNNILEQRRLNLGLTRRENRQPTPTHP